MPASFILTIGEKGACLGGTELFAENPASAAAQEMADILRKAPERPLQILCDMHAEDYRIELVPQLGPFDMPKLVTRRLEAAWPDAFLRGALRYKKASRKEARYLFAALNDDPACAAWLEWIETLPNPCLGINPLPLSAAATATAIAARAGNKNPWHMAIFLDRVSGIRQIVTHHGELIMTRLTQPPEIEFNLAEIVRADITGSRAFLARNGLNDNKKLSVSLVLPEYALMDFETHQLPIGQLYLLTPDDARVLLKLPGKPITAPYSDALHAAWLQRASSPLCLMTAKQKIAARDRQMARTGWRAAAAALLLTAGMLGYGGYDVYRQQENLASRAGIMTQTNAQLAEIRAAEDSTILALARLRHTEQLQTLMSDQMETPWKILHVMASRIDRNAYVVRMAWHENSGMVLELTNQPAEEMQNFLAMLAKDLPDYRIEQLAAAASADKALRLQFTRRIK